MCPAPPGVFEPVPLASLGKLLALKAADGRIEKAHVAPLVIVSVSRPHARGHAPSCFEAEPAEAHYYVSAAIAL